jgi:predicted dithiol-disulfide oxidoreductase (DUF899 family)
VPRRKPMQWQGLPARRLPETNEGRVSLRYFFLGESTLIIAAAFFNTAGLVAAES